MRFVAFSILFFIFFIFISPVYGAQVVTTSGQLDDAVLATNLGTTTDLNIDFGEDIDVSISSFSISGVRIINADRAAFYQPVTYSIDGQGFQKTGNAPFFVKGAENTSNLGVVTIRNLTISTQVKGGQPHNEGGAGLAAGGGVFMEGQSSLILENVTFDNCSATGNEINPGPGAARAGGGSLNGNNRRAAEFPGGGAGLYGESICFNSEPGSGGGGYMGNGGQGPFGFSSAGGGGGGGGFNGGNASGTSGGGGAGDFGDGVGSTGGVGSEGGSGGAVGAGGGGGAGAVRRVDGADGSGLDGGSGPGGGGGSPFNGGNGGHGGHGFGGGGARGAGGIAGDGGWGGGGGASPDQGGNGGFGGGGGPGNISAGNGGFGGGGASYDGSGGFGAGGYPAGWGAVGANSAALGGAIFMMDEAELTIKSSITFSNNSVSTIATLSGFPTAAGVDIFMMSGGQIIVEDLTTSSEVPNPIESNMGEGVLPGSMIPTLDKGGLWLNTGNGDRVFTLNGDNTYTGVTNVDSGKLYVNGSVITPVNVDGGSFGGVDTVVKFHADVPNSGNLTVSSGTVEPGGEMVFGELTVEGDLEFNGTGGMFSAEVDSVANADNINVEGNVTINGSGTTLDVDAAVGNFLQGQAITIIRAEGSIDGEFDIVNMPLLPSGDPLFEVIYHSTSDIMGSTVQLSVLGDSVFVDGDGGQTIDSGNPRHVVDYTLALLPVDPTSDLGFIIEALGVLSNGEINKALNLLHPAGFADLEWINMTNNSQVTDIFSNHYVKLCCSYCDYDECTRTCHKYGINERCCKNSLWVHPFGIRNSQDQIGQLRGYHATSGGVVIGYDHAICNSYIGIGGGYTYSDFKWKGGAGDGRVNQFYGGIYGSYYGRYLTVDFSSMAGKNFYDVNREIYFNSPSNPGSLVDRVAKSDYSGIQWTSHLGLVLDFLLDDRCGTCRLPVTVIANADYFFLRQDDFSETGADSINLDVREKSSHFLRTELGVQFRSSFGSCYGCFSPYLGLSWVVKAPLSSSKYRSNFVGQDQSFTVNTTTNSQHQFAPELGVKWATNNSWSLILHTHAEIGTHISAYFADVRLGYSF